MFSSGILMFRIIHNEPYFLLVHPGGPFFKKKDLGHWTIPKGKIEIGETSFEAAIREFNEETGYSLDTDDKFTYLGSIKQKGGKTVYSWAWRDYKYDKIVFSSNYFEMKKKDDTITLLYPEIDNWQFFNYKNAKKKINPAQIPFLDQIYTIFKK